MRTFIVCLALLAALGCGSQPTAQAKSPSQHVFVAIDTSGSARTMLGAYARGASSVAMQLEPGLDRLTVFRFDHAPVEIYDGSAPESSEKFKRMLVSNLDGSATRKGTAPGRLLKLVAEWRKRGSNPHPATVVVYTDGGNDDLSAEGAKEYRKAIRELAADDKLVKLILVGVRAGQREAIRQRLAPLGNRVLVQGEDDMGVTIERSRA